VAGGVAQSPRSKERCRGELSKGEQRIPPLLFYSERWGEAFPGKKKTNSYKMPALLLEGDITKREGKDVRGECSVHLP